MKKIFIVIIALLIALPGISIAKSDKCATKYPVVLAHGMGRQADGITPYWGKTPGTLENNGAAVYITKVNAMDSTVNKAIAWKRQVLEILALSGKGKVNVIAHSHGTIYTRYAISNLGMAPMVESYTSLAGPHRGSVIADLAMDIIPDRLEGLVGATLDLIFSLVMGDVNGNTIANGYDMVRSNMINVFNPNTPNMKDVYYQSYAYKITNALGGGILLATWKIIKPYDGDNDGLVSTTSAQWGEFKGVVSGCSFLGGVNHTAAVRPSILPTPGYDPPNFLKGVVADLKTRGY